MRVFFQDIRYGIRMLGRARGFTAFAIITLALGIGVNTAVFTMIDAMFSLPQQFPDPESLIFVRQPAKYRQYGPVCALDYLEWRDTAHSFAETCIFAPGSGIVTGGEEPERVEVGLASASLLPILGFDVQLGRPHRLEEDQVGAELVTLISDGFWERRYGRDPNVLGKTITVNDRPRTIVGVLPSRINDHETLFWTRIDLLMPLVIDPAKEKRGSARYVSIARLKPGVTVEQAQAEMNAVAARLAEAYPDTNADTTMRLQPLLDHFISPNDRIASIALLAAVGSVLLIACSNLAGLLLVKASSRGRELAVRAALGAGRFRIIRQLFTESMLLALAGGAVGLMLGVWAFRLFVAAMPPGPFRQEEIGINLPVLTYTFALSLLAAIASGLAPALRASRASVGEALKEGAGSVSGGRTRNRLQNAFVIGQLAMALPLLTGAGLVIRHIVALRSVDVGFNTERLLTMQVSLPTYRYQEDAQRVAFFHDSLAAISALPGVSSAGGVNNLPLGGGRASVDVTIEGREVDPDSPKDFAGYMVVTPGYFRTLEIPLLGGRSFTDHDHADAERVAIVNKKMAQEYWPGQDVLGRRFKLGDGAPEDPWLTVVGVVGDVGHEGLYRPRRAELFLPLRQAPSPHMALVARTVRDPAAMIPSIRSVLSRLDPDQPVHDVRTVDEIIHRWLRDDRLAVGMCSGLAALALCLASVGLYGVMSYSVVQRTHEIGVRTALGAGAHDILLLVVRRCLKLAVVAVVIGVVLSVPVGLGIESQLFGVGGLDPLSYVAVGVLMMFVALIAGYIPARRATKVDPMVALRYE
ncbi:MAG: ABC transporter permease [Phycisphaerales bacterium]|nr:MAG: ABC transporter permease [Phycisphaerales bacterium]